jgi:Sensors of blue-light using FAD
MATPHLARIAYVSATRSELSQDELQSNLSIWRRRNAARGVTGFLLYHRASVFQLLEGFPDVVHALYQAIARDPRHHFVAKLVDEPVVGRSFGDWSMGHARVVRTELGGLPALHPFLDPAFRYWHCDEAMARELICAFTTGPWRRSIS